MHQCDDSVSEGGREEVRQEEEKQRKTERRREKGEGGLDAAKKLGQIHFQGLIPSKVFVSVPMGGGVYSGLMRLTL